MRAYNIMWARAQAAKEIEILIADASQRIQDTQKLIDKIKAQDVIKKASTTKRRR